MKFLITKELEYSRLLKHLMAAVLFFILLYLGFDVALHAYVIGAEIQEITLTLFGDRENFVEPMLLDALLLQVHTDLFMTLFALLILTAITIRVHDSKALTMWAVHLVFIVGILAPATLLLAYLLQVSWLVPVWLFTFALWHFVAFILGVSAFKRVLFL